MPYRGPDPSRIARQWSGINGYNGEACTWRQFVASNTGTSSAYFAGGGITNTYREQTITAMWAAPQMGESRFRETPLAAGMVMAGDAVISMPMMMGSQDEVIWRGVTYRVEGDATPVHIGARVWYRTVLRRGDATG